MTELPCCVCSCTPTQLASTMGPVSLPYCAECMAAHREPYDYLVARTAMFAAFVPQMGPIRERNPTGSAVGPTCAFFGKADDEFWDDVEHKRAEMANRSSP